MRTYTNSEVAILINEHIHSARDRQIIYDRLVNGMTHLELSEKYYLSDRQIKRIIKKADVFLCRM